jgi:hypothetical protein
LYRSSGWLSATVPAGNLRRSYWLLPSPFLCWQQSQNSGLYDRSGFDRKEE